MSYLLSHQTWVFGDSKESFQQHICQANVNEQLGKKHKNSIWRRVTLKEINIEEQEMFYLSIYLSVYLSIHPSIYLSIYLSMYLSIYV